MFILPLCAIFIYIAVFVVFSFYTICCLIFPRCILLLLYTLLLLFSFLFLRHCYFAVIPTAGAGAAAGVLRSVGCCGCCCFGTAVASVKRLIAGRSALTYKHLLLRAYNKTISACSYALHKLNKKIQKKK